MIAVPLLLIYFHCIVGGGALLKLPCYTLQQYAEMSNFTTDTALFFYLEITVLTSQC